MPSKQMEFYTTLKQETETKIATYGEFYRKIEDIKKDTTSRIKSLKADMKFIAKSIAENNKKLEKEGQERVPFSPLYP